ncbi:MAG: Crp/Fnr family transcriptional regulator [Sphaerochaetaceae bacterium]
MLDIQEVIDSFPNEIKRELEPFHCAAGEAIIRQGEEIRYGYFFVTGSTNIIQVNAKGKDFLVAQNNPNHFCCLMDIYSDHQFQCYTVTALTDCSGYRLGKRWCLLLLKTKCLFQEYLINQWAEMFYVTSRNACRFPNYSTKYKLIEYLRSPRFRQEDGTHIIRENRDLMAISLGCSRRTLFRLLKEFRERNVITLKESVICLSKIQEKQLLEEIEDWMT